MNAYFGPSKHKMSRFGEDGKEVTLGGKEVVCEEIGEKVSVGGVGM